MRFRRFEFMKAWDWIAIIPTVILTWNEQLYWNKNFRLSIHWLGWHLSWQWIEDEEEE